MIFAMLICRVWLLLTLFTFVLVTALHIIAGSEEVNGSNASLTPSPEALAKEGERLDLQCIYAGSSCPDHINWYINGHRPGLVIDASNCTYILEPAVYETNRYKPSCNRTRFTLSIANISKAKDNGTRWECDFTIPGVLRPRRASTTIVVIEAFVTDGNGRGNGELDNVSRVIGVVFPGLIAVSVVVGYLIYRRRKKDGRRGQRNIEDNRKSLKKPDPEEEQGNLLMK